MDIQMALALIEEYVESLESYQWADEYDRADRSLFEWLVEYGCDRRQLQEAARIIEQYTGYLPKQIRHLGSAIEVKQALYGALNTEVLGRRLKPQSPELRSQWALENVEFGFGETDDPIDSGNYRN
jgi:hypothetical protein